ncbi:copper resistance CopC family protein [Salinispora sp. H7-4]|uniref:copper resistance CopC family protein n=1 Tax=Salinispora sp. H7-4 TaxID=2748321 RepID=UPI0015D2C0C9|nr:copper resistance CopC family protein [Salinispora sp. H7-4]NYT93342.1 copper resistance protein CopC [Salinispora sp. H7-4]
MRTNTRPRPAGFLAAVLAAAALLLVPAAPAAAHNSLKTTTPAKNAELDKAPAEITLEFLQKLDPAFTTIVLSDAAEQKVPTGEPVVTGAKGTISIDGTLANGTYTVAYRVVSADGHPVQGSYAFTVADPAGVEAPAQTPAESSPTAEPTTPPTEPAAASPVAATDNDGGGSGIGTAAIGGGILLVLVAGGLVLLRRRRGTA